MLGSYVVNNNQVAGNPTFNEVLAGKLELSYRPLLAMEADLS